MSEHGSKFGDFLTGLIVGAAAGYVLALLSAPRPGEETRHMLEERGREIRDRARETVQSTVERTGQMVSQGRERAVETLDATLNKAREQVDEVKGRGVSVVDDVRAQVSGTMRRTADRVDPNVSGSSEDRA